MTKANRSTSEPKKRKGWTLEVPADGLKASPDRLYAKVAADGIVGNARTLVDFGAPTFGELSLSECARVLKESAAELNQGDLGGAVTMLAAQSVALNAIFGELARRASLNMGEYMDATERYMRLAFKAQSQCRATLETLAAIKNPPVLFARQANINNGGQQQVNNGQAGGINGSHGAQARTGAHAGESTFRPNELLEDCTHGCTQLDTRATAAAGRTNHELEPMGALDRPA